MFLKRFLPFFPNQTHKLSLLTPFRNTIKQGPGNPDNMTSNLNNKHLQMQNKKRQRLHTLLNEIAHQKEREFSLISTKSSTKYPTLVNILNKPNLLDQDRLKNITSTKDNPQTKS